MMYKTIYRFRVRVEGKPLSFPLHLCIYQNKAPKFEELLERMQHAASLQGISMNDYYITLGSTRYQGGAVLHDDQSLQAALKQTSERHYLELTLQRKRARTLSPPAHLPRRESMPVRPSSPPSLSLPFANIPVIKPTVLRWSPVPYYSENRRSSSISSYSTMMAADRRKSSLMMDIDTEASSCSIRKDSGISLDYDDDDDDDDMSEVDLKGPVVKKQRAASADHQLMIRKLPDLHSSPALPVQHRPSLFEPPQAPSSTTMLPTIVHPLEFRRPSTAPPSPQQSQPGFGHNSIHPIKLPAITALTAHDNNNNNARTQLAPIHRHLSYDDAAIIRSPPQTPCSAAKVLPPTFSESPVVVSAVAGAAAIPRRASSTKAAATTLRRSSSDALGSRTPGQFLCEHAVDGSSGRICGQTFRRSYDLSRHQSIHMKNRPFCYCGQCGKKFTRMDALRRHERVQGHAVKRYTHHRHPSSSSSTITPSVHPQQARV